MSGFDHAGFLAGLPWTVGIVVVIIAVAFIASRVTGRHNGIDTAWGLFFVSIAVVSFLASGGDGASARRWLLLVLPVIWGARLAAHVFRRSLGKGEDPRYAALLEGRGAFFTFASVYLLQGALALLISAPIQVGSYERAPLTPLAYLGVAIWLVGFGFETIGDAQLKRFKADRGNKGRVMDRGLWRYTRHPNYFGDACVWVGVFLVAADRWPGVLTVFAPAIMVYLLVFGSGKRNLERSLAKRPGYRAYMARTSGFFPLPRHRD